jgi:hypothetical protein
VERNGGLSERRKWRKENERKDIMNFGRTYSRMKAEDK